MKILSLPGLYNSDAGHWQSVWESHLPDFRRVQQHNWQMPQRNEWVETLAAEISSVDDDIVVVAHSLGCALLAWWLQTQLPGTAEVGKVKAALLVAPPDVARAGFPAPSFSPMPLQRFPFASTVIASDDDPWCELAVAEQWAKAWGSEFHCIGAKGHINSGSGLAQWKPGQKWLSELISKIPSSLCA